MRKMELVDRERYEILRTMLEDRAQEIVAKLKALRESLPDEMAEVKDPEELCVHEFVHGLDFALIEMKSRTLARINEALQRLEMGTYGECVDCEEPIANVRLQALPFAERCRDCQQAREEIAEEAAKQQSRFGLPTIEEAPAAAARERRPDARRSPERAPAAASGRRALPGQLELRRQVAGMERAGKPRTIAPAAAAAPPAAKRANGPRKAIAVRRTAGHTRKHA
jgi:DnaK suppressor protein